jgi:hypothetical protein
MVGGVKAESRKDLGTPCGNTQLPLTRFVAIATE